MSYIALYFGRGRRARRFVFAAPPNLDGFMTARKILFNPSSYATLIKSSYLGLTFNPLIAIAILLNTITQSSSPLAPTAVHTRTSEPPRRFEPFLRLAECSPNFYSLSQVRSALAVACFFRGSKFNECQVSRFTKVYPLVC